MNSVVSVTDLSKCYRLGVIGSGTLREDLNRWWAGLRGKPHGPLTASGGPEPSKQSGEIWALKNIDFEVRQGEVLGIIGRNGAGKSTLLKILSRITAPTGGRAVLRGRVGSMLEVGTGFHPELTGRENIYLNGATLGMSKRDVSGKFDEIVTFAEVERFVDTPVKRYSSGMLVRLAFSVAAHLEPEILIVDEVLAVGDAAFKQKCIGRLSDMKKADRTVLYVSHAMESVQQLCSEVMLLKCGTVASVGAPDEVIQQYISDWEGFSSTGCIFQYEGNPDSYYVRRIEVLDEDRSVKNIIRTWDFVRFRITFHSPVNLNAGAVVFVISTITGVPLLRASTQPDLGLTVPFVRGENHAEIVIPKLYLSSGHYIVGVGLTLPNITFLYKNLEAAVITVESKDIFGSGKAPSTDRYYIPMPYSWAVNSPK